MTLPSRCPLKLLDEPNEAAFVTLTVGSTDLRDGLRILKRAFAKLRRRAAWHRCAGHGVAGIEVNPGRNNPSIWNVHLHAVVLLYPKKTGSPSLLGELWKTVLVEFNAYGSAEWQPVVTRSVQRTARGAKRRSDGG